MLPTPFRSEEAVATNHDAFRRQTSVFGGLRLVPELPSWRPDVLMLRDNSFNLQT